MKGSIGKILVRIIQFYRGINIVDKSMKIFYFIFVEIQW